jgi:hypothetical protein
MSKTETGEIKPEAEFNLPLIKKNLQDWKFEEQDTRYGDLCVITRRTPDGRNLSLKINRAERHVYFGEYENSILTFGIACRDIKSVYTGEGEIRFSGSVDYTIISNGQFHYVSLTNASGETSMASRCYDFNSVKANNNSY